MSLFIYCPRKSEGAFELVKSLGATRLRKFDGLDFWDKNLRIGVREGDIIICWGASIPELDGIKVLNALPSPLNFVQQAKIWVGNGVATLPYTVSQNGNLLPRLFKYSGGRDLFHPPEVGEYYTQQVKFVKEYRLHSFGGKCIRAGVKVHREGYDALPDNKVWVPDSGYAHPWIRNFEGGWKVNSTGFKSTNKLRAIAHTAVKVLGLTFGAVDVGETPQGSLHVIDVSTSPRLDPKTLESYIKKITKWLNGEEESNGIQPAGNGSTAGEEEQEGEPTNPF